METKTQLAQKLFKSGDLKGALRIVKDFRMGMTQEDRKAMSLGYEALVHPDFYRQLRKDPELLVQDAKARLETFFTPRTDDALA